MAPSLSARCSMVLALGARRSGAERRPLSGDIPDWVIREDSAWSVSLSSIAVGSLLTRQVLRRVVAVRADEETVSDGLVAVRADHAGEVEHIEVYKPRGRVM